MTTVTSVMSGLMDSIMTKHADDGGRRGDELRHALVEALAERVHVVGDAREHVAHASALEVAHAACGRSSRRCRGAADSSSAATIVAHDPALHERAGRRQQVQPERERQDPRRSRRSRCRPSRRSWPRCRRTARWWPWAAPCGPTMLKTVEPMANTKHHGERQP